MAFNKRLAWLGASFVAGGMVTAKGRYYWNGLSSEVYDVRAAMPMEKNRPNEIMKFGFPSNSNVHYKKNYVFGYDSRLRNASWVFEHLNKDMIATFKSDRSECQFKEDLTIHRFFRSTNEDFYKSGYDRGHLAAAANHRASQTWVKDTFDLSNVVPQNPHMNQQAWNNLEKYVRSLVYHYDNVYVCTGPLFLPMKARDGKQYVTYQVIGNNHVAVPTHLFKVVVCERNSQFELLSFVMPNDYVDPNLPLKHFLKPVESIERAAGFIMFDRIPRHVFKSINHGIETVL